MLLKPLEGDRKQFAQLLLAVFLAFALFVIVGVALFVGAEFHFNRGNNYVDKNDAG